MSILHRGLGSEGTQAEDFITGQIYIMIPGRTQSRKEEVAAAAAAEATTAAGEAAGVTARCAASTPITEA